MLKMDTTYISTGNKILYDDLITQKFTGTPSQGRIGLNPITITSYKVLACHRSLPIM